MKLVLTCTKPEREQSCICLLGCRFKLFLRHSVGFWNCSNACW